MVIAITSSAGIRKKIFKSKTAYLLCLTVVQVFCGTLIAVQGNLMLIFLKKSDFVLSETAVGTKQKQDHTSELNQLLLAFSPALCGLNFKECKKNFGNVDWDSLSKDQ